MRPSAVIFKQSSMYSDATTLICDGELEQDAVAVIVEMITDTQASKKRNAAVKPMIH